MAAKPGLREQKKTATRQAISDVATRLFAQRGFDSVTVEEIAAAAQVSKMTVFNYFPRKEDLVVDREEEFVGLVRDALSQAPGIQRLQSLFLDLASKGHPLMGAVEGGPAFWTLLSSSPVLLARAWAMTDAVEEEMAKGFRAQRFGQVEATIMAGMITAVWRAVWRDGIRRVAAGEGVPAVRARQKRLLAKGFEAVEVAFGRARPAAHKARKPSTA